MGAALLVFAAGGFRFDYLTSQSQVCEVHKAHFSEMICSESGYKTDWQSIEGLVQVRIPKANSNAEAYLIKKELTDVSWVQNPGWLGFKFNCILDRVVLVQNNQCKFL
ncbi:hypothetical protein AAAA73_09120 [Bdellovibrio sp. GT3]